MVEKRRKNFYIYMLTESSVDYPDFMKREMCLPLNFCMEHLTQILHLSVISRDMVPS